jgi:UDP-N-acetylmuramate dehydrogenase
MKFINNASLKNYNTFKVNVNTKYLIKIHTIKDLKKLLDYTTNNKNIPICIIGEGSNILFTKNFHGIIIKININKIIKIKENKKHVILKIYSGVIWNDFVNWSIENNLYGVENLSYIPGTIGASVIQNIGAYGVELKNVLLKVETYNMYNKKFQVFRKEDCKLHYRESIFKNTIKAQIITAIIVKLKKKKIINMNYHDIHTHLLNYNITNPDNKILNNIIYKIRKEKIPNPKKLANAGSFFKNPIIAKKTFKLLSIIYPDLMSFFVKKKMIKLSAAQLIKKINIDNKKNVGIYEKNCLIIVNQGKATGKEIYNFSKEIVNLVYKKFHIKLEREVRVI